MKIIRFQAGDMLKMKKKHPCGADTFEVLRAASDVRIRCVGCGRDLTLPRVKLERGIKEVKSPPSEETK